MSHEEVRKAVLGALRAEPYVTVTGLWRAAGGVEVASPVIAELIKDGEVHHGRPWRHGGVRLRHLPRHCGPEFRCSRVLAEEGGRDNPAPLRDAMLTLLNEHDEVTVADASHALGNDPAVNAQRLRDLYYAGVSHRLTRYRGNRYVRAYHLPSKCPRSCDESEDGVA